MFELSVAKYDNHVYFFFISSRLKIELFSTYSWSFQCQKIELT